MAMSAITRSKASRKRYAKKHHNHNEIAGRIVRHRKIKEKQIIGTVKAGLSRRSILRVRAQIDCHSVFDRLWQEPSPTMPRWKAYEYLQEIIGSRHIRCLNKRQCDIVAERVKKDFPQLFGVRCNKRFAG
jgi:hypothetical protein